MFKLSAVVLLVALVAACTTSPTNRRQVVLYSKPRWADRGKALIGRCNLN